MELPRDRWGGRPVWAEIDLDALAYNVRALAARAAPAKLYAIVKANAYGHGAVAVGAANLEGPILEAVSRQTQAKGFEHVLAQERLRAGDQIDRRESPGAAAQEGKRVFNRHRALSTRPSRRRARIPSDR